MNKIAIILLCLMTCMQIRGQEALAFYYGEVGPPGANDVHIGKVAIVVPIGRILLVRKDSAYCAIKFVKLWSDNLSENSTIFVASGSDEYAICDLYYQGDNSGDFSKNNVEYKKEELSFSKPRGIGRLAFSFGNNEIKCGSIVLLWSGKGAVHFYGGSQKQGDYGIELAPTKWVDISQVNVFDPKLKWLKYDENRKRVNIPIDNLWEDN